MFFIFYFLILKSNSDLNAVIQLRFGKSTLLIELRSFDILAKLMAELKQMQVAASRFFLKKKKKKRKEKIPQ